MSPERPRGCGFRFSRLPTRSSSRSALEPRAEVAAGLESGLDRLRLAAGTVAAADLQAESTCARDLNRRVAVGSGSLGAGMWERVSRMLARACDPGSGVDVSCCIHLGSPHGLVQIDTIGARCCVEVDLTVADASARSETGTNHGGRR